MLYVGIAGAEEGISVEGDKALAYAMAQCGVENIGSNAPAAEEFCHMLVEWFFSGNWKAVEA